VSDQSDKRLIILIGDWRICRHFRIRFSDLCTMTLISLTGDAYPYESFCCAVSCSQKKSGSVDTLRKLRKVCVPLATGSGQLDQGAQSSIDTVTELRNEGLVGLAGFYLLVLCYSGWLGF